MAFSGAHRIIARMGLRLDSSKSLRYPPGWNGLPASGVVALMAWHGGANGIRFRCWCPASCGRQSGQSGQSGEGVGGHRREEAGAGAFDATRHGWCLAADGRGPTERRFDPLRVLRGHGVAIVPYDAPVDGRRSRFPGNVWGHAGLAQVGDEHGGIMALVYTEYPLSATRVGFRVNPRAWR